MDFIFVLTVFALIAAPAAWVSDRLPDAWVDAVVRRLL